MSQSKAARRYAQALFLLASEQGKLDAVQADLQALGGLLAASPELRAFLGDLLLPPSRRSQVLGELFERQGQADPLVVRFLFLLAEKKRLPLLADIVTAFGQSYDQARGILRVRVTSARPLDAAQVDRIVARLRAQHGKEIRPELDVDPALLGGFVIQVGDQVRDLSVETQLQRLQRQLVQG